MRATPHRVALVSTLSLLVACTTSRHLERVDSQVARVLERRTDEVERRRLADLQQPQPSTAGEAVPEVPEEVLLLGLEDTLALAVSGNRDYQTELEALYLTAVSLLGTRHRFSPQLTALLGHVFADGRGLAPTNSTSATFGVSQILPWGGQVSLDAGTDRLDVDGAEDYRAGIGLTLSQPLLRGAGHEVSHEALVQAERSMIYAVRDFELFREDFAIDTASRFYGIVRSQQRIENQVENLDRATFDRKRAQALFEVGRLSENEVLRAQRSELNSQNDLLAAQESYELELDLFRIFLGLPEGTRIDIQSEPPPYVPVAYDVRSAVAVAMGNRLDLINRREQLEDAERGVRIARDGMLPDLDLALAASYSSSPTDSLGDVDFDGSIYSAGLTLALPLDRVDERHALRSAQISHERAKRGYEVFEETVRSQIRSAIRELARRATSIEITRDLITGEEKNKRIAELRFERGEIDNRELVEAENSLLDARNGLIDEQVAYELARLRLLRDLGILFIDERGVWQE